MYEQSLVVGKFAPLHPGHQLVLDRAREVAHQLTIVIWSRPDFDDMPNAVRAEWLRTLYPQATVLIGSDGPENHAPDAEQWAYVADLLQRHDRRPDVVLTSEAYGGPFAEFLGATHLEVDASRTK